MNFGACVGIKDRTHFFRVSISSFRNDLVAVSSLVLLVVPPKTRPPVKLGASHSACRPYVEMFDIEAAYLPMKARFSIFSEIM
jgi:hypothetical protein